MKKLVPIILGFIIGAVLTYYFCPRPLDSVNTMAEENYKLKDTISVADAKILSKNWGQRNPVEVDSIIEVEGSKKKTRSVEWSLEEITEYLEYAKKKSGDLGFTMTGVRVYVGNYGKNADPIKKNRNTMFIVPTGKENKSKASSLNTLLQHQTTTVILLPPLNNGSGGSNGYPQ